MENLHNTHIAKSTLTLMQQYVYIANSIYHLKELFATQQNPEA